MRKAVPYLLLFFTITAYGQNFDTVKIRPFKVTENIYMLKGSGGNIGVMTGKDGTIVIDDQFGPLSNKINGAIKTLDPGEVRFLINTHVHGDHSGGNENFKRMGVTIVAQDAVRARMMTEQFSSRTNRTSPPRDKDAWPVITFPDRMSFHLNDEDIELTHLDPGHTDGDLVVRFVKANVFHVGDAFRSGYPFIDVSSGGTFAGFITSLDKMIAMMNDQSKVICGHGELSTRTDVKSYRDKMVDIRDQVALALKKGKKVEDIGSLGLTDKYEAEMGKGFVKGKDLVLLIAESLKQPAK